MLCGPGPPRGRRFLPPRPCQPERPPCPPRRGPAATTRRCADRDPGTPVATPLPGTKAMRTRLAGCRSAVTLAMLACSLGTAAGPVVAASPPRVVWIADWGLLVREGIDVVHAYGLYYRYADARWYVSASPAWPLGAPPPVPAPLEP